MRPVGRVTSNFGDHGTKCNFSPPTFATGCHFSMYTVGSLQCFPDPLAEFKGERIEGKGREWVKQEWSNNGR